MTENDEVKFTLYRFNPRRVSRGAEGAQLIVSDSEGEELLWMSESDIRKNIKKFGPQQGLLDAQTAYEKNVAINP